MSKITLLMIVLAITAIYFGVFGWFLAGLFVFWAGARTYLKFEEPEVVAEAGEEEAQDK
mgnify:CR=1 FL=1